MFRLLAAVPGTEKQKLGLSLTRCHKLPEY
jgi:hypothetical protein